MKTTYIIIGVIVVLALIGAIAYALQKGNQGSAYAPSQGQTATSTQPTVTQTSNPGAASTGVTVTSVTTTGAPSPKSFTVNGNDANADVTTITVAKGTPVSITFGADAGTTYHGGLDFRSSVVNTGTITPGSTKTVTFTADQSFSFTPYWPATNIAKPYKINIVVN